MSLVNLQLGVVAYLELNNPPLNVISADLLDELDGALARLEAAPAGDVRALVVSGTGKRAFSVGSNVKEFAAHRGPAGRVHFEREARVGQRLASLPMPTIAAIEGNALGGGLELALCCDLRVASQTAQLGLPEVRLAVTPGMGGTQRLPRLVGLGRAKELLLTGRIISADEALRIGLINEVVRPEHAASRARQIGDEIAECGPLAVRAVKALIDHAFDWRPEMGVLAEVEASERVFGTEDMLEGAQAFVEKRPPRYRAR